MIAFNSTETTPSQVTLDIALRWSAEIGTHHDSIDIALLWSARDGKSLK